MSSVITVGEPPIRVSVRRSARARRLSLRVSRLDGRVTLTLPRGVPEREGRAFVIERERWLRDNLLRVAPALCPQVGSSVPVFDIAREVVTGPGRGVHLEDDQIIVSGGRPVGAQVKALLQEEARVALLRSCDRYAARLGRPYSGMTLRDTRSRWGSCSAAGKLMFSWRLAMAPWEVLDYVAAHEVAHLQEMNHAPAFWAVVDRLCPGWQGQKRWLSEHGPALHRFDFSD